jgi:hypothetical protein
MPFVTTVITTTTTDQYGKTGALITLLAILCYSIISSSSFGYGKSDVYNSGYDHGCIDAGISDKASRYINQPEAGPSLNSDDFMHGYNDGFSACSASNDNSDMEEEDETKIPVMSSQRATYIMNVCTGRILIDDLSVNRYCSGIQFCLTYKSMAKCYTDLKNGEIENWSIFGLSPPSSK